METTSAVVFIGAVIVGVTELLKRVHLKDYLGAAMVVLAALVGALVGLFDTQIGLTNITVAQGIMAGFAAAGVYQVAKQVG